MKKRKKLLSRKKRVLRNCAWLAVILVLASALQIYRFTPGQAIRAIAEIEDVENPKVVHSFYDGSLPITRFAMHHLVQGDNSLMLCATGWHLLMGWYDRAYATVETWDGTNIYAGVYGHKQDENEMTYFYGRVDADSVESMTLEVDFTYWDGDAEQKRYLRYEFGPEDFLEENGALYICKKLQADEDWEWFSDPKVTCITGDGRTLITEDVGWRTWST